MGSLSYGWNKFVKRITIHAEPQAIYHAWATRQGIESWFLRYAKFSTPENITREPGQFIEAGDTYFWLWHGYSDEVYEERKIIKANGRDLLCFDFSGDCIVTVQVKKEGEENVVELTQENIPEDNDPATSLYIGCGEGWTFYLTNLKSVLEGGPDLRNKNPQIPNVINA
jgi:uncharacterized protein YndB with AHSA1/START domain